MKRFIRNFLLPLLGASFVTVLGLMFLRSDAIDSYPIVDGVRIPESMMSKRGVTEIVQDGRDLDSVVEVFGIQLPGTPLIWYICWLIFCFLVGWKAVSYWRISEPPK